MFLYSVTFSWLNILLSYQGKNFEPVSLCVCVCVCLWTAWGLNYWADLAAILVTESWLHEVVCVSFLSVPRHHRRRVVTVEAALWRLQFWSDWLVAYNIGRYNDDRLWDWKSAISVNIFSPKWPTEKRNVWESTIFVKFQPNCKWITFSGSARRPDQEYI